MWNTWLAVLGIAFIFLMTSLGSAVVFLFKGEIPPKINHFFFGFASGVMVAAAVWSLLLPSLTQAEAFFGRLAFVPAAAGVIVGGLFLVALDKLATEQRKRGGNVRPEKSMRLFLAVTLHNIPEGLAVGFAFGAASRIGTTAAYVSALGLAIGIGIQNFPEGAAISLPMKAACKNGRKAFLWGVASGVAEPVFAIVGYFLASALRFAQPWLLGFAAGAMLFVAAEDLIPDARSEQSPHLGAWGVLIGFVAMMVLDVALG